jgi:Zn-dependent protease
LGNPALLLGWFAVFIFSVTLHEAAHAWVAARGGDLTAYSAGQVSLNPLPHIRREPFGMLLLPVISLLVIGWPIGYASAPFDPGWAERHHKRAAIMALAGPLSNLLLAIVCMLIMYLGLTSGMFSAGDHAFLRIVSAPDGSILQGLAMLLSMLLFMNLLLFVLNIVPIPPLDGSAVIPLFLNASQTQRYRAFIHHPAAGMIGMLLIFILIKYIYPPVHFLAIDILYSAVR